MGFGFSTKFPLPFTPVVVTTTPIDFGGDLNIYYGAGLTNHVTARCSRWNVQDYNIIIEMWLKKSQLNALMNNTRPGAVKELKRVIFSPKFYDMSWSSRNTLKLKPVQNTNLYKMRGSEKIIYPTNISSSPLPGDSMWINVKLEGKLSGSTYIG